MRAVVQRVKRAQVTVEGQVVGAIGPGLAVLIGVGQDDKEADAKYLAEKIATLRIFSDEEDKMNLSVQDLGQEILAISQFTLFGDCRKGRRPGFSQAMGPQQADELYNHFVTILRGMDLVVQTGQFQADMDVELVNHGPVTILLDSQKTF